MNHDWQIFAVGLVFALVGWLLLRFVSDLDNAKKNIHTLFNGFRTLKDRYGIDCDVEDED